MIGPYTEVVDSEVQDALDGELERQRTTIELIASENFTSPAVLAAQGSVLTNKYAEGYPGKRYYGGCEQVDKVENIAIERAKQLFGAEHVNVQPHSGSQANEAAYAALIDPGDKVLSMDLAHGGHLTHGMKLNFSGRTYDFVHYGVGEDGYIDYDEVRDIALAGEAAHDPGRGQRLPARFRLREVPRDLRRGRGLLPGGHGPHRRPRRRRTSTPRRSPTARS